MWDRNQVNLIWHRPLHEQSFIQAHRSLALTSNIQLLLDLLKICKSVCQFVWLRSANSPLIAAAFWFLSVHPTASSAAQNSTTCGTISANAKCAFQLRFCSFRSFFKNLNLIWGKMDKCRILSSCSLLAISRVGSEIKSCIPQNPGD